MTATSVTLIKVKSQRKEDGKHWGHYTCVPTPEPVEGAQPFRRKISDWSGRPGCKIKSYMYATLWDGKPQSGTSYY